MIGVNNHIPFAYYYWVVFGKVIFKISLFNRTLFLDSAKIWAIFYMYYILLTSKYAKSTPKYMDCFWRLDRPTQSTLQRLML